MLVHNCGLKRSLHSLFLAVLLISLIFACTAEYSHNDNDDEDEDFEVNLLEMERPQMPPLDGPAFFCKLIAMSWNGSRLPNEEDKKYVVDHFDNYAKNLEVGLFFKVMTKNLNDWKKEGTEEYIREHCSDLMRL